MTLIAFVPIELGLVTLLAVAMIGIGLLVYMAVVEVRRRNDQT